MARRGRCPVDARYADQAPQALVMAVVPIDATVVMCADDESDEQPWLDLRTGRFEPKPTARDCGDRRPQPSPPASTR